MGGCLFVRVAARIWFCQRADGHRAAARRCSARPVLLQRGGRTRTAHIHRGSSERPDISKADQGSFSHRARCAPCRNLFNWHSRGVLVFRALGRVLDVSTNSRDLKTTKLKELTKQGGTNENNSTDINNTCVDPCSTAFRFSWHSPAGPLS